MFFTIFALSIVAIVIIIFIIRASQKKKMSRQELEKERKEGIVD